MEKDGAVIARGLRRRDPDVLDRLIETYQHRLLRYLVYLTNNRERAEDLFQETWMRVLERGATYNGKSRFDTWLFAIARHLVIDASRRKTAVSLEALTEPQNDNVPMEFASEGPSALDGLRSQETSEQVGEELTRAPLSTVKSRLYRGLEALKPLLIEKVSPSGKHLLPVAAVGGRR
jgi:RNA polymerase sigma-70 factor (ECF subfamily)